MLLEHITFFPLREKTSLTENKLAYVDGELGGGFLEITLLQLHI